MLEENFILDPEFLSDKSIGYQHIIIGDRIGISPESNELSPLVIPLEFQQICPHRLFLESKNQANYAAINTYERTLEKTEGDYDENGAY